jgi:hypothetical protein
MPSRKQPQTASDSVQSAAPGELEVRLARLGLLARGAQDRQAALPGPLQDLHRALLFYGASMWLAALRGYAGCEVLAVSNWLLGRDDQVGCALFWPIDQLEHYRTGRRPA